MRKLIKQVKRRLFYRTLIQRYNALNGVNNEPKVTPNEAKTVALLFDATTLENRKEMERFSKKLQKEGKKVTILGFFNEKTQPNGWTFRVFNKKDVSWKGIPSGNEVQRFLEEKFDLLYHCSITECLPLEWLAALAKARFKIGPAIHDWIHYDLIIGGKFENLNHFIEQAAFHAAKITKNNALSAV
jgi:hypothetical protein